MEDTPSGRRTVPMCSRCRKAVDPDTWYATGESGVLPSDFFDYSACPSCGAVEGIALPKHRPVGTELGIGMNDVSIGGGVVICTACKVQIPYGLPRSLN